MGHNSRYKGGPTLADAEKQGATHLVVECHGCRCQWRLELGQIMFNRRPAPRHIPVNHLPWGCPNCRQKNFTVSLRAPAKPKVFDVPFKMDGIEPKARRRWGHTAPADRARPSKSPTPPIVA